MKFAATLFIAWCFLHTVSCASLDVIPKELGLSEAISAEEGLRFGSNAEQVGENEFLKKIVQDPVAKVSLLKAIAKAFRNITSDATGVAVFKALLKQIMDNIPEPEGRWNPNNPIRLNWDLGK